MAEPLHQPWLTHYPEEISAHIDYEEKPLFTYLQKAAKKHPGKQALHFMGNELTYQELYVAALKIANHLQLLGIEKGDRVSVMLPNCPQNVISYYGVLLAGGIVVQTNPLYMERELHHQLADSGSKIMICLDLVYPKVAEVKKQVGLEHVLITSIKDVLPFPKNKLYPIVQRKRIPKITYDETIHEFINIIEHGKIGVPNIEIDPKEDLALLQYTGGTTGWAKGVMLTHYNLIANTQQTLQWMYNADYGQERILGVLPFFHVYGMTTVMNFSVMHAAKMILVPKFKPKQLLKTINKHRPTLFPGAPTIYIALLNDPDIEKYDLSSIEACISGSAPLPNEVQQSFEDITKGKIVEGYGLTEASPVTHSNLIWGKRVKGSIGLPYPDTDAAILSTETGELGAPHEIGELMVRGPQVMKGYWNLPGETKATFHDNWLLTGDIGYMDEDGYFYIIDRKKNVIIASGFNIYPREVEEILYEHEAVQEAAVVGIPDEYRGETVKAFVALKEGYECTEADLDHHCRQILASYKVPKLYEFRDELPKTTVGKILRRALLAQEDANV